MTAKPSENYKEIDQSEHAAPRSTTLGNIESNSIVLRGHQRKISGRNAFNTLPDEPWSPSMYFSVRVFI
jgi:hypothetical protein